MKTTLKFWLKYHKLNLTPLQEEIRQLTKKLSETKKQIKLLESLL